MAYFDEADASVEYASLRIASRKQMRTAGAEEVVSPTLPLLKPRGEFYKESELSCVTAVHKKKIVWEDNKVCVKDTGDMTGAELKDGRQECEEDGGGDEQEDACELADGREKVEEREEKEGDEDNENCKKMEDEREERNFVQRR
ncbi:uncharacterized protein MONOS_17715 [Monocercomonoides exilis]|uniref:uncharacterized protein n=1 Tax=Monocercomonoides exilis TaxID=2049356 RepID=UPI003559AC8A|nr:hypothetical protein MONOS_17715 [Monocercomonoides exilis]